MIDAATRVNARVAGPHGTAGAHTPSPHVAAVVAALDRLDDLLAEAVARFVAVHQEADASPFGGIAVGLEQVAVLLAGRPRGWLPAEVAALVDLAEDGSRLSWLTARFGLRPLEVALLLIALAPEIDRRYERIYGFLQDDLTRRRPTVDFALSLCCPELGERLGARPMLAPGAPLLRYGLLRLVGDPQDVEPPLASSYLAADDRLANFLLGADEPDQRLGSFVQVEPPAHELAQLVLPEALRERLTALAASQGPIVCYLHGAPGSGRRTVAGAVARAAGVPALLVADGARALVSNEQSLVALASLLRREAALQGAAICWEGADRLEPGLRAILARELAAEGLAFLTGEAEWSLADGPAGRELLRIELPPPDAASRTRLWDQALGGAGDAETISRLADSFRLTPGQISQATATARHAAHWRDPSGSTLTEEDLAAAARSHSSPRLSELAQKIRPVHRWGDLVLPEDSHRQLHEVCASVRQRPQVLERWGFGDRLAYGRGLCVLFAGESGTGKTMAAGVIAGELGLELYRIDLAMVVSKYIGETEKNLARVFAEAEGSSAVLFFDEADALFGKRSEVQDAHDRYANLEVAYLLQRVEEYEGLVILASNLRKNVDDAFVRRMAFIVEFPFPGVAERLRIWERVWPPGVPLDQGLDLGLAARRWELAGGSIRNIALAAAYLAADEGGAVTMAHLRHAARREYRKLGKVAGEREFG